MHVSGVLEGAGTENGVEVPPEERKAQVQNILRGAGRVMSAFAGSTSGATAKHGGDSHLRADEHSAAGAAGLCAGRRGARGQHRCPGQTPDPSAQREGRNGPLRGQAPEDSQPVGPWSHAQRGRPASPNQGQAGHLPGHVPLAPQALQPRPRPKTPPSAGTRAAGIPPKLGRAPRDLSAHRPL